jgi:hypothetical protein
MRGWSGRPKSGLLKLPTFVLSRELGHGRHLTRLRSRMPTTSHPFPRQLLSPQRLIHPLYPPEARQQPQQPNSCDPTSAAVLIMPIFHDLHDSPPSSPDSRPSAPRRTDLHSQNGLVIAPGTRRSEKIHSEDAATAILRADGLVPPIHDAMPSMLRRVELIERIKRGKSPAWPSHHTVSLSRFLVYVTGQNYHGLIWNGT